jgi:hypothetical protein
MPPTTVSRVAWRFRNVTRGFDFWPLLESISIKDEHPVEQATFECDVEDIAASLTFEEDDIIRVTHDDGSGAVDVHEGPLTVITWRDHGRSGPRVWSLQCTDYTPMLGWDVIKSSGARRAESASDRLTWLMSHHTHGISVASATLPSTTVESADYLGTSVLDGIEQLCQDLGLSFYVDFDKGLHIFTTETVTAPFAIVAAGADGYDSMPFWDWSHERDVSEQRTKALVIGDKSYALIADTTAVGLYGVKEGTVSDASVRKAAGLTRAGTRALLNDAYPAIEGRCTIAAYGLRAGMTVEVDHHLWPGVATDSPYIVVGIETRAVDPHDDNGEAQLRTEVTYSDRRRHKARGRNRGGGDSATDDVGSAITLTQREMSHLHDPIASDYIDTVSYGNPVTKRVARGIFHNLPYTTVGCPLGNGGWQGISKKEAWYEYTTGALADDVTGARFTLPAIDPNFIFGPVAEAGPYFFGWSSSQPTDVEQYAILGVVPSGWPTEEVTVDIPRSAINEGGTSYFVIGAGWDTLAETGFFCAQDLVTPANGPMGASGSGGEGGSGQVNAPTCTATYLVGAPAKGLSPWTVGIGDIDGTNRTFELPYWDGAGVPKVNVNGLILTSRDYTYDEDAGTVTLNRAPEGPSAAGEGSDVVTFQYRISR